jgi:hypothetical protein
VSLNKALAGRTSIRVLYNTKKSPGNIGRVVRLRHRMFSGGTGDGVVELDSQIPGALQTKASAIYGSTAAMPKCCGIASSSRGLTPSWRIA